MKNPLIWEAIKLSAGLILICYIELTDIKRLALEHQLFRFGQFDEIESFGKSRLWGTPKFYERL